MICLNCGKVTKNPKYCSHFCQQSVQYNKRIESWKSGNRIESRFIRKYLIKQRNSCWNCGITEWMGKPITLELEHIDGNSENNLEENLSILCPNCHSQTDTYKGRNAGNGRHYRRIRYKEGKSY